MIGDGRNFVLKVQGDSMVGDGILNGDYVVVRKQTTAENGQTVVAMLGNEATVKRIYYKSGRVELHPANPAMVPFLINDEEDFRIEGVVVGVIRDCFKA
jgi:repressor LexA